MWQISFGWNSRRWQKLSAGTQRMQPKSWTSWPKAVRRRPSGHPFKGDATLKNIWPSGQSLFAFLTPNLIPSISGSLLAPRFSKSAKFLKADCSTVITRRGQKTFAATFYWFQKWKYGQVRFVGSEVSTIWTLWVLKKRQLLVLSTLCRIQPKRLHVKLADAVTLQNQTCDRLIICLQNLELKIPNFQHSKI